MPVSCKRTIKCLKVTIDGRVKFTAHVIDTLKKQRNTYQLEHPVNPDILVNYTFRSYRTHPHVPQIRGGLPMVSKIGRYSMPIDITVTAKMKVPAREVYA